MIPFTTSTNFCTEAHEPSFLRTLRNQQSGRDADRHERPIARPRRTRVDDDEDGPTYVDAESNDPLSKAEYDTLVAGTSRGKLGGEEEVEQTDKLDEGAQDENVGRDAVRKKQEVTEVGSGPKKRKAVKVLGTADAEEENIAASTERSKPKKKSKAVKLSFGIE